jgi:hypothetical protein
VVEIEYRRRASIQEKGETVWRAFPDRLEYHDAGGALRGVVPFDRVTRVRLAFAPGRLQQKRFLMELSGTRSQFNLSNMHFKGIAQFEDRTDTFFPLVRAVVAGVHAANPNASFRAGEKPAYYVFLLAFVLVVYALLALVLFTLPVVPGNFTLSILIKLGIILVSLPLLLSWGIHARPRRFDPETGLEAVLSAR